MVMTDRELQRMQFRLGLFARRGCTAPQAEALADKLLSRDRDQDDRRVCEECEHLLTGWRCARGQPPLPRTLHRCPAFAFRRPT